MSSWEILLGILLIFILAFLSTIESGISQLSYLALRVLAEKHGEGRLRLLHQISLDRRRFLVPMLFATQLILVVLTVMVTHICLQIDLPYSPLIAFGVMGIIVVGFRQLIPFALTHRDPERVLLRLLPSFRWGYALANWAGWPVMAVIRRLDGRQRLLAEPEEDEATDEEIQAYLGVGEEEGIFESTESDLIQSALEFGSTLVREIMSPRSEMVAIEEAASLAELRDLIVRTKHSRVPVYRERLDQIVGIASVRALLGRLSAGREGEPITPIVTETLIVPETKRVSELLKEMQARADQMAIVINEYGTVSGLVTIEDLLEEIVGEIRDEDEFHRVDLVYEGDGSYIVRGGVEIDDLEEALGVEFGEHEAATVSGLVVENLGAVPTPGQTIRLNGVTLQVLSADRKRIHTMRVRVTGHAGAESEQRNLEST
jgi:putative hemolysin